MSGYQQLRSPFEDPSVRAAAAGSQPEFDYNPFESSRNGASTPVQVVSENAQARPKSAQNGESSSKVSAPATVTVDLDTNEEQNTTLRVTTEELERRQKELDARAAEIERRERDLLKQSGIARQLNWPPLPQWCCIKSCFHQDFENDISPNFRGTVKFGYGLWLAHVVAYLLNIAGGFCYFFGVDFSAQSGTTFGLCIFFGLIFIPASLLCWYRPLYKAFRDDSSISFFIFFIIMFAQFSVCVLFAIGIPGWGSAGFITGLSTLSHNLGCGIVMLISGSVWGLLAAIDISFLIRVHRLYRTTGASFQRARQEFAGGVETTAGRTFTQGVAQSAFGTFNQRNQPTDSSGLPR